MCFLALQGSLYSVGSLGTNGRPQIEESCLILNLNCTTYLCIRNPMYNACIFVCVCVCARECVRVYVFVCVCDQYLFLFGRYAFTPIQIMNNIVCAEKILLLL